MSRGESLLSVGRFLARSKSWMGGIRAGGAGTLTSAGLRWETSQVHVQRNEMNLGFVRLPLGAGRVGVRCRECEIRDDAGNWFRLCFEGGAYSV